MERQFFLHSATTFALFLHLLGYLHSAHGAKLSEPKILLPYDSSNNPISYQIDIHNARGCFTWRSTRPDIAAVTKPGGDLACTNSVIVTAVTKSEERMTTILLAENADTGEILRCDVIVDAIATIGIETTTRELFLEDSPEKFELFARDSEENTFSTLKGVSFEWSLVSDSEGDVIVDAHNILRILTFAESDYDTPAHIGEIESRGLQGEMILVEGVKTGSANVHVKLKDPAYKSVRTDTVRLIVIANVMLQPVESYIILFSTLKYRADLIKQGILNEVPLPSDQYHLQVVNSTVCSLETPISTVTGETLGQTDVLLRDKNMSPKLLEAFHPPKAIVHVVLPGYITFTVLPGRKWVFQTENQYEITIELSDKDSHKITSSDNIRMMSKFVKEHFDIHFSSVNGTYHVVTAKKPGKTEIHAHLNSVLRKDGSEHVVTPVIRGQQSLYIYDPIRLTPEIVAFPWTPDTELLYTAQLTAVGGSGEYVWNSNNTNVVNVNNRGLIDCRNELSLSKITAADQKNNAHTDTSLVYVIPPVEMEFSKEYVEQEVGGFLDLGLIVTGQTDLLERIQFTDCRQLHLTVETDSDTFTYSPLSEPVLPEGSSCTSIRMKAVKPGPSFITAVYTQDDIKLTATVTIAAFDPLVVVDPAEFTVLALGSTREISFYGGPLPWILEPSQYYEKGNSDDMSIVGVQGLKSSGANKHKLLADCKELGDQKISLTVGNKPTISNKHPAERQATVSVYCREPSGVQLLPQISLPDGLSPCPIKPESSDIIPVHSYKDLELGIVITDELGRHFENFSSLHMDWKLSNPDIAKFKTPLLIKAVTPTPQSPTALTGYRVLSPEDISATLTLTLTVNFKITKEIKLRFVEDVYLTPNDVTLFNHPNNRATLKLNAGSGYFSEIHVPTDLARVTYDESGQQVLVEPERDGRLVVTIKDLCLVSRSDAAAVVHLSGVHTILLQVRDKVQQGNELTATVKVRDHTGTFLPAEHFQLMSLKPQLDDKSNTYIKVEPDTSQDSNTAVFRITGVELGTARLSFVAQAEKKKMIKSNAQDIQVFPPLRLDPRNVTLIVGANIQMIAVGGPQPQSVIEYSLIGSESVAEISSSGMVDAQTIGSTKVRAAAVGYEDGQKIVYSADHGEVHVIVLTGIRIHAPLTRLVAGTQMPLYAEGMNEHITPFSLANAFPALSYDWSITNSEVASLRSVYHQSNIDLPAESRFSYQLHTHRQGHVTIKLRVGQTQKTGGSITQILNNKLLTDEVHIQVFSPLELLSPSLCTGQVLITPNTESKLKTNKDSSTRMSYKLHSDSETGLLSISDHGEMKTGSQTGQVDVVITATESSGANQSLALLVKIKPVRYIMFNLDTVLPTSQSLTYLPVGANLKFTISYHDDVGKRFDFVSSQLAFRPNRYDLAQVAAGGDNGTLFVQVPIESPYAWGGTALKVWEESTNGIGKMADYINLNTQTVISGLKDTHVGDIVCLSAPFQSSEIELWSSSSSSLVIDRQSGVIQAINSADKVVISYQLALGQFTSKQMRISSLETLSVDNYMNYKFITMSSNNYLFHILLNNNDKTSCHGVQRPAGVLPPFSCHLTFNGDQESPDISSVFSVKSTWSSQTGMYLCEISVNSQSRHLWSSLSILESNINLLVSDKTGTIHSHPISITFLPPPKIDTEELYLTQSVRTAHIDIRAVGEAISHIDVKVDGRYSDVVSIDSAQFIEDGLYKISISSRSTQSFESSVKVYDRLSEIEYEIPLHVSPTNQTQRITGGSRLSILYDHLDLVIFFIICIIVTTICLIAGYMAVFGTQSSQSQINQSYVTNSPISSIGSSPKAAGDTVSPFLKRSSHSPGRIALWSSGYDPQEVNQQNVSLFNKSPGKMSPGGY